VVPISSDADQKTFEKNGFKEGIKEMVNSNP